MGKKITINEIAKIANVSRGTVDRVVNNRGYVSKEKRVEIEKIIEKLNFKPNIHARNLALSKKIEIGIILPKHDKGDFWEEIVKGANQAAENYSLLGLNVSYFFYDQDNLETFNDFEKDFFSNKINAILSSKPQNEKIASLLQKCKQKDIPFILINSNDNAYGAISNIGQDAYYGGRLAAKLLNYRQPETSKNLIFNIYTENNMNPNVVKRIEGFYSYVIENNIDPKSIELIEINITNPDIKKIIKSKINELKNINDGIFIPNSRAYIIADCMIKSEKIRFVGFDLLQRNINFLKMKRIDFLINQKPYEQTYQAIEILYRLLGTGVIPDNKIIIKEEIITLENC